MGENHKSVNLNFNSGSESSQENRKDLGKLSEIEILQIFNEFTRGRDRRRVVIPVGFPQAGKSFLLSSLFYYAKKATDRNWKMNFENRRPFADGFLSVNDMVEYFEKREAYPSTPSGTVDIISAIMTPTTRRCPEVKFAFIDLAGEDLKEIKASNQGKFGDQINGILKAVEGSKPIFLMITPFDPIKGDYEEDTLHDNFLNHMKVNLPNLFSESIFIVIVSQWDKNPHRNRMSVEEYIEEYRPQLYAQIKGSSTIYGEYSVGDITSGKDANGYSRIFFQQINKEYPNRLWNKLYHLTSGKSLEKSWWEKLFG